ncbi:phosphoribosylformylglycinamidine synthase, purS protein [Subtercola vilae]|uniref:Phosphoribosylformylglycinamidine synthase subunit PurS n=1 Tax=Subtercola vilae TaxID=2056433 RepID=A0A4T2BKG5_9MICO|nr:phosphoribosylformylglycinamidine synthase, purS protein [Subtercola vilae]
MPTIVVEVMPKAELLDPQGKAVAGALARQGRSKITGVRVGKRFEIEVEGPATDEILAEVSVLADEMLANLVIEDVISVHFAGADGFGHDAEHDFSTGNVTNDTSFDEASTPEAQAEILKGIS